MIKSCISKKGFTLAEVLITLGIIGVVAAMTLPTLLTNIEKKALETATKKFHSTISNAVKVYMADNFIFNLGASDLCTSNYNDREEAQEAVNDFVRKYFNVVEECNKTNADKCFAKTYKNYSGEGGKYQSNDFSWYQNGKFFVLNDGTALFIQAGIDYPPTVYVDINGQKGPNVVGYDLWSMSIFHDGTVDESGATPESRKSGVASTRREERFQNSCKYTYGGCFGHFLNNGYKFDY